MLTLIFSLVPSPRSKKNESVVQQALTSTKHCCLRLTIALAKEEYFLYQLTHEQKDHKNVLN